MGRAQQAEVKDHAVVAGRETGDIVPASPDRQRHALLGSDGDGAAHRVDRAGPHHNGRPPIDHAVPDGATPIEVRVGSIDQFGIEPLSEASLRGLVGAQHGLFIHGLIYSTSKTWPVRTPSTLLA